MWMFLPLSWWIIPVVFLLGLWELLWDGWGARGWRVGMS